MNGPDALQPGTIRDWCDVTGNHLLRDEIDIIMRIDTAFIAAVRSASDKADGEDEGG